jgi:hypothetical protein
MSKIRYVCRRTVTYEHIQTIIRELFFADTVTVVFSCQCKNRQMLCTFWALEGECQNNPSYMTLNVSIQLNTL